jgi:hypothetical protein
MKQALIFTSYFCQIPQNIKEVFFIQKTTLNYFTAWLSIYFANLFICYLCTEWYTVLAQMSSIKTHTWLMFTFLGRYIRMVGKLFADHKLESCYCIHGDPSRIAGTLYGLCHYYMVEIILLIWSEDINWMLSFYCITSSTLLTDILANG